MNHDTVASISQAGEKPTKEELSVRIDEVADLWRKGVQKREVARYASIKAGWNISSRTLDRYIAAAKKQIAKEGEQSRAVAVGFLNCGYREMFARSMMDKSYDAVDTALLRFGRLYGIELGDQAKSPDRGGTDDEQDRPIAILVGPERLLTHEEWDAKHGRSIPALKPKAPGE